MTAKADTPPAPTVGSPLQRAVGPLGPERYVVRYLCDGYILADAFRPDWSWGSKGYVVPAVKLGEHTDEDVIRAAMETAPPGYWLHHIEAIGGQPHHRDVFKKGVPLSRHEPSHERDSRETL